MTVNSWSSKTPPWVAAPPSSHFDAHPLLFLSYLLQLVATISNPVKSCMSSGGALLSVCHLPENHIYMFHCHTLNPPRQLLSNPMRCSPPKNTQATEWAAFDQTWSISKQNKAKQLVFTTFSMRFIKSYQTVSDLIKNRNTEFKKKSVLSFQASCHTV